MKIRNLYAIDENMDAELFTELLMHHYEHSMDVRVLWYFTDELSTEDVIRAASNEHIDVFEREGTYWTKMKDFGGIVLRKIFAVEMEVEFITGVKNCSMIMAQIPVPLGLMYH